MKPESELPIPELRKLLQTEFVYLPWIYWLDFLGCAFVGWTAFVLMQFLPVLSLAQVTTYLITVFATYRGVLFVHEIAHFKQGAVPGFALAWNLVFGMPYFVPSFMYRGVHNDHHSKLLYGTKEDGEYVPFGAESPKRILLYLVTTAVSPLLLPLRFIVLAPLSWAIPGFRKIVVAQLSSLVIDFDYQRGTLTPAERRDWLRMEPLAFAFGATIVVLISLGTLPWTLLVYYYFVSFGMFFVNSIRTIAAHRYANPSEPMTVTEQFLDSVNIVGSPIVTTLLCPVGLRFHALHHLFPTLPYHSLAAAHAKILRTVPADSPYHSVNEPNLTTAIRKLWRSAAAAPTTTAATPGATSLMPNFLRKTPEPRSSETSQVS